MKNINLLLVLISSLLLTINCIAQTKVMSYNIRYDNKNDGDNWWELRRNDVVDMLQYYHPEFLGLQEAMPLQFEYIADGLDDYDVIGHGRDGVGTNSESTPIFYNRKKYELQKSETFWLSDTPEKISIGWDAALNRIALYGKFKDKATGKIIHIINTHFDHRGDVARHNSARVIMDIIKKHNIEEDQLIVMGDLNCEPSSAPIGILTEQLTDAFDLSDKPVYGPVGTFNGFDISVIAERRIDYIFTKNVSVDSYRCIDDRRINNLHLSDHFAVMIEMR